MKKLVIIALLVGTFQVKAQREDREDRKDERGVGFRKENVFFGGSIALGFGSVNDQFGGGSNFVIGVNPEIGYSFAKWLDLGFVVNAIYNSTRFNEGSFRYRQTAFNYGVGAFMRIHPTSNFFIQAQPEHNWIRYKFKNLDNGFVDQPLTVNASSFLVGVGYGTRVVGESNFFTVIMLDLGKERFSPYRDGFGNALPVIRGGFNWYLKSKKKKSQREY